MALLSHSLSLVILSENCSPGWKIFDGNCYKLSKTNLTWAEAEQECKSEGSHLVSIESKEEDGFVRNLGGKRFWIGGNDLAGEGTWVWADSSPLTYDNFHLGNPDNGDLPRDGYAPRRLFAKTVFSKIRNYLSSLAIWKLFSEMLLIMMRPALTTITMHARVWTPQTTTTDF